MICDLNKALSTPNFCVSRSKFVLNRASIPKAHSVLSLVLQKKLKTKDKLLHVEVNEDNIFPMCGLTTETIEHCFSNVLLVVCVLKIYGLGWVHQFSPLV